MVKITKIYTRGGDDGTTGLVDGQRVLKSSLRVQCYGEVDELNSFIGFARSFMKDFNDLDSQLSVVQNELFDIGAELASNTSPENSNAISEEQVSRLELLIDKAVSELPELRSFVLPGGSQLNASLHIARTVCRRAERSLVALNESEFVRPVVVQYVNRLSDYLFAVSRLVLKKEGIEEVLWVPGGLRG